MTNDKTQTTKYKVQTIEEEVKNKEAKGNITDPESRIMKTQAGYVQGYNAQAVVTNEQIIVVAELTQEENDVNQLHPKFNKYPSFQPSILRYVKTVFLCTFVTFSTD